jgi:hypothetical protein
MCDIKGKLAEGSPKRVEQYPAGNVDKIGDTE